jgi:hypothetical protein
MNSKKRYWSKCFDGLNPLRLLKEQIEGASVISRKNTGAGFFYKVKGQTSLKAY